MAYGVNEHACTRDGVVVAVLALVHRVLERNERKKNPVNGEFVSFTTVTPAYHSVKLWSEIDKITSFKNDNGFSQIADNKKLCIVLSTPFMRMNARDEFHFIYVLTPNFVGWCLWEEGTDEII